MKKGREDSFSKKKMGARFKSTRARKHDWDFFATRKKRRTLLTQSYRGTKNTGEGAQFGGGESECDREGSCRRKGRTSIISIKKVLQQVTFPKEGGESAREGTLQGQQISLSSAPQKSTTLLRVQRKRSWGTCKNTTLK